MEGDSFRCPHCDVSLRFGFVRCPACEAIMLLKSPSASAGATSASTGGASAGSTIDASTGASYAMTVRPREAGSTLTDEQRQEIFGDCHRHSTEWAELLKKIMKVFSHRRSWAIDAYYRMMVSSKGGTQVSNSDCGVGDWSATCLNADSEPPHPPILKGRAKVITECAFI
jgi:hypothetical protein